MVIFSPFGFWPTYKTLERVPNRVLVFLQRQQEQGREIYLYILIRDRTGEREYHVNNKHPRLKKCRRRLKNTTSSTPTGKGKWQLPESKAVVVRETSLVMMIFQKRVQKHSQWNEQTLLFSRVGIQTRRPEKNMKIIY